MQTLSSFFLVARLQVALHVKPLENCLIVLDFVPGDEVLVLLVVITSIFQCSVVLYVFRKICIFHRSFSV